jgi:hypothetical protein
VPANRPFVQARPPSPPGWFARKALGSSISRSCGWHSASIPTLKSFRSCCTWS